MKFRKTIVCSVLLIIVSTASFFSGMKYNNNKRLDEQRSRFLQDFYTEIDMTIHLLSSVDKWGNSINGTDVTINPYGQLMTHMISMEVMSRQTHMYMLEDKRSSILGGIANSFQFIRDAIGGGISSGSQLICKGFLNDGVLSKTEISFLISLRQDLQNIKSALHSKEAKHKNLNLTIEDLTKILEPFANKYDSHNLNGVGLGN